MDVLQMQRELQLLTAQYEAAAEEKARLEALLERIDRAQVAKEREIFAQSGQRLQAQELLCRRLQETVDALPSEAELRSLRAALRKAEAALQTAEAELAMGRRVVQKGAVPEAWEGLDADGARERAQADQREYRRLHDARELPKLPALLVCLALILAGLGLCFAVLPLGIAVAGVGAAALAVSQIYLWRRNARVRQRRMEAEEILRRYGAKDDRQLTALAEQYTQTVLTYEQEQRSAAKENERLAAAVPEARADVDVLIAQTAEFAPACKTARDCREAISAALLAHERLAGEQRVLHGLRQKNRDPQSAASVFEPVDTQALALDQAKLEYEYRQASQRLETLQERAERLREQMTAPEN